MIKKGSLVRYKGKDKMAEGKSFVVLRKAGTHVEVMWPVKFMDGTIHRMKCSVPVSDFIEVRKEH